MAASLEEILLKLLQPSNEHIQEGSKQLQEASKNSEFVPALCNLIIQSGSPQIKQLAAVLLRRKLQKQWKKLPTEFKEQLKQLCIDILLKETERPVRNAIAQVIGVIARHDLGETGWPQLQEFFTKGLRSSVVVEREVSSLVLSTVADNAGICLKPLFRNLVSLISNMLQDPQSNFVQFHAIRTMTAMVQFVGSDELPMFRPLIPQVLPLIGPLIAWEEDYGCEAMELFDELLESEVSVIAPYIKQVVQCCSQIASKTEIGDNARVKALSCISWLIRLKRKAVMKHKLVNYILKMLFPIMCSGTDEDDEEDEEEEDDIETQKPSLVAVQVLDIMALNLPPEKLIPPLMKFLHPSLQSANPQERKAGLLSLAVLAEGCADYIRNNHLEVFLHCTCDHIPHANRGVRHAAFFALGQFSLYLQPEINQFHAQLLPLLLEYLKNANKQSDSNRKELTRMYYALEMFCENLGKDLVPYLPVLLEQLLDTLQNASKVHQRELAISAIGATASAVEEEIMPYFESVMGQLQAYLQEPLTGDLLVLQSQAIDTLGVLARSVGRDHFLPLSDMCVRFGLKLLADVDDPDLRRCTYGLFAAMSTVLKEDMAPCLPDLVRYLIASLQSTEGVVTHYNEDTSHVASLVDETADEEDITKETADDDDDDIEGFSIENAYLEEKEDACQALGEIAVNLRLEFLPFYEASFSEILKLIEYSALSIRKAAITSLGHLYCMLGRLVNEDKAPAGIKEGLGNSLKQVLPKLLEIVNVDEEREAVMTTLETLNEMLKWIGGLMVAEDALKTSLTDAVKNVFQQKTLCQGNEDMDESGEGDEQAEQDAMLIEYAGDIIPSLAKAMGGAAFTPYLAGSLHLVIAKAQKYSSASDKSFATGVISETVVAMGPNIAPFVEHLFPVLTRLAKDDEKEVKSNAVFGLGVLAEHGRDAVYKHYPTLLQIFSHILSHETNRRTIDNLCASVCRLIITNSSLVPIEEVLPALLQRLPIEEDLEETSTVYKCLANLYQSGHPVAITNLSKLLAVLALALTSQQLEDDTVQLIKQALLFASQNHESQINGCMQLLPQEKRESLVQMLQVT